MKNKILLSSVLLSLTLFGCSDEIPKDVNSKNEEKSKSSIVIEESSEDDVNEKILLTEDNGMSEGKESDLLKGLYEGDVGGYVKVKQFLKLLKETNSKRDLGEVYINSYYRFNDTSISVLGEYNSKDKIYDIEGLVYYGKFKDTDTKDKNKGFDDSTFDYNNKELKLNSFYDEIYEPFKINKTISFEDVINMEKSSVSESIFNQINLFLNSYEDYNSFIDFLDKEADKLYKEEEDKSFMGISYYISDDEYLYQLDVSNYLEGKTMYTLRFDSELKLVSKSQLSTIDGNESSLLDSYTYN